jgi:hypothetical protein
MRQKLITFRHRGLDLLLGRHGARRLTIVDLIDLASHSSLPLATLKRDADDWELIDEGGDTKGGYKYSEPHQCECGLSWDAHTDGAFYNQKPNAQDITKVCKTVEYPKKASDTCDAPCVAVEQSRHEHWRIFKNKKTGRFWLTCSKRVQWHCERVQL